MFGKSSDTYTSTINDLEETHRLSDVTNKVMQLIARATNKLTENTQYSAEERQKEVVLATQKLSLLLTTCIHPEANLESVNTYALQTATKLQCDKDYFTATALELFNLCKANEQIKEQVRGLADAELINKQLQEYIPNNASSAFLHDLQNQALQEIAQHPKVQSAKKRLADNAIFTQFGAEGSYSAHDNLIYVHQSKRCWRFPGGYTYYRDRNWCPPADMIEDIMSGQEFTLSTLSYKGMGGYLHKIEISDDHLQQIELNSIEDRLYYQQFEEMKVYSVGFLFGVITKDGREYDIDGRGCEAEMKQQIGTFSSFGPILWKGEDVTNEFWARVDALVELKKNEQAKNKVETTITITPFSSNKKMEVLQTVPSSMHLSNQIVEGPKNLTLNGLTDGLISNFLNNTARGNGEYISEETIISLQKVTSAKKGDIIKKQGGNDLMRFDFDSARKKNQAYDDFMNYLKKTKDMYASSVLNSYTHQTSLTITEYFKYYFGDLNPYEMERALGKQGEVIVSSLARYHSALHFSTNEERENTIRLLTDPTLQITHPLDILIQGNSIFLAGKISLAALQTRLADISKSNEKAIVPVFERNFISAKPTLEFAAIEKKSTVLDQLAQLWDLSVFTEVKSTEIDKNCDILFITQADTVLERARNEIILEALLLLYRIAFHHNVTLEIGTNPSHNVFRIIFNKQDQEALIDLLTGNAHTQRLIRYLMVTFEGALQLTKEQVDARTSQSALVAYKDEPALIQFQQTLIDSKNESRNKVLFAEAKKSIIGNDLISLNEILSTSGFDINFQPEYETLLHIAVNTDNASIVDILLAHGADPKLNYSYIITPLVLAAEKGQIQCMHRLLKTKEILNIAPKKSLDGAARDIDQALLVICDNSRLLKEKERFDSVSLLVSYGADLNVLYSYKYGQSHYPDFIAAVKKQFNAEKNNSSSLDVMVSEEVDKVIIHESKDILETPEINTDDLNSKQALGSDISSSGRRNSTAEERYESQHRFFSSRTEEQESNNWDFTHPSTAMIILTACIPVIGWAYLVYVLFNAITESYSGNDEENTYSYSN